jgi:hypothetical protein
VRSIETMIHPSVQGQEATRKSLTSINIAEKSIIIIKNIDILSQRVTEKVMPQSPQRKRRRI